MTENKSKSTNRFSVVIPTFQGEHKIMTVLNSLAKQKFKNFEVIVVIDGSTDNTEAMLSDLKLPLTMRIVKQPNKGRAGTRNTGALHATGEVIVFFDDDIEVPPDALEQYNRQYDDGYQVIVGGFFPLQSIKNEFYEYASYLNDKWGGSVNNNQKGFMSKPYISAANFVIQKKIFHDLNGFDEGLRDAEDFDLAVRLFERNIPIYFNPDIAVAHTIQSNFKDYVRRLKQYHKAQSVLKVRNPATKKYADNPEGFGLMKSAAFWCFSFDWYITLIDIGFFSILPRKMRYKLYDIFITANTMDRQ